MQFLSSLQSLFETQIENSSSVLNQIVYQFLKFQSLPPQDIVDECFWEQALFSEEKAIENWKGLLTVNLLCRMAGIHLSEMASKVRFFGQHPWNQHSQYFRSLVALNHCLASLPIPEVGPHLLESGAALIDVHEYCPWLSLPYAPQHFEYGIFICLLSLLTNREELKETALRLARWQMNTLDSTAKPLTGLFVREKDAKNLQHLCLSYLFFKGAALLEEQNPFAAIAQATIKEVEGLSKKCDEKIHPLWPLIERWFEGHRTISSNPLTLPEHIYDPSTALVGYRSPSQHVICTLHGGHTGLGSLRFGDIEIVSYGPQYLPLAECLGFGIEGNALADHGVRRSMIEWRRHSFCLKGCTRLVDQPTSLTVERGDFRGIWLEVTQEFKRPHFSLKASFLGLDGWDSVAFSFFIKSPRCKISSGQCLLPRTLERYEGNNQLLTFEGEDCALELCSQSFSGVLQVIPLAGGNNFWGADFLVAYLMQSDQRHYQWNISPKH